MKSKYCNIGGQALIEGVMMKNGSTIAISVRKPEGDIETSVTQTKKLFEQPFFKLPLVRGVVELIKAMVIGIKALTYSAEFYMEDDEEPSKFEKWVKATFKEKADSVLIAVSIVLAFGMAFLMFGVLPAFLAGLLRSAIHNTIVLSLIEGIIKVALFVGYIYAISRMREIKRVFEYHGAEHKTIHCFEAGLPLTPENATGFTRIHPRCGTSFLLFVLTISIVVFSFVTWSSIINRVIMKIVLMPLIAGISYEVLKLSAKYDNWFLNALSQPGLWMQRLTTREPNLKQLAVAIAAMEAAIEGEGEPNCPL